MRNFSMLLNKILENKEYQIKSLDLVAEWSQKILKKFGMSGIYGKIKPNMEETE